jgi:hypothetical protein
VHVRPPSVVVVPHRPPGSHRHGLAAVLAFRTAAGLPYPRPLLPLRYIEIKEEWGGSCVAANMIKVFVLLSIQLQGGPAAGTKAMADHAPEIKRQKALRDAPLLACHDHSADECIRAAASMIAALLIRLPKIGPRLFRPSTSCSRTYARTSRN